MASRPRTGSCHSRGQKAHGVAWHACACLRSCTPACAHPARRRAGQLHGARLSSPRPPCMRRGGRPLRTLAIILRSRLTAHVLSCPVLSVCQWPSIHSSLLLTRLYYKKALCVPRAISMPSTTAMPDLLRLGSSVHTFMWAVMGCATCVAACRLPLACSGRNGVGTLSATAATLPSSKWHAHNHSTLTLPAI